MGASHPTSPTTGLSEEDWIASIFTTHTLRSHTDCSRVYISLILDIVEVKWYLALQRKISEIIPEESKRPTIHLSIISQFDEPLQPIAKESLVQSYRLSTKERVGSPQKEANNNCSVAIIGGMGPVSDAELVCSVCQQCIYNVPAQKKSEQREGAHSRTIIRLLSAPPPRKVWDIARRSLPYISSLMYFLGGVGQAPIFLASNTSHVYFPYFQTIAGTGLQNLTTAVVKNCGQYGSIIESKDIRDGENKKRNGSLLHRSPCVLIIGTSLAASYRLYEQSLEAAGMLSVSLPHTEQQLVQCNIDKVKSGTLQDSGEQLYNIVISAIEDHNTTADEGRSITVVLLGCTEIPLALGKKAELIARETGVHIVNSEEVFRDEICRHMEETSRCS